MSNPTKDRYNIIQLFSIIGSVVVYVYLNRYNLTSSEGWMNFLIYVGFNLLIAITGQKVGSIKETIRQFQMVMDGSGTSEAKLNEAEYNMKVAAAHAGIAWEHYNQESEKKSKKKKKVEKNA